MVGISWNEMMSQNVKDYARLNNLNICEVEKNLQLSKGYISRIASGTVVPRVDVIIRIADLLKVTIDDLFHVECFKNELMVQKKKNLESQIEELQKELAEITGE